jgi:hypothetical protein
MDEAMQGIMSLPEDQGPRASITPEQMAIYDQMRQTIPPKEFGDELLNTAMQADPQAVQAFKEELMALEIPLDTLKLLNEMVDAILASPDDYQTLRREYMRRGVTEDLLPAQFDPAFFAALNMALDQMPVQQPQAPMAMAGGGIASLAQYGRNGDTMLAHITPEEAALLKARGGAGTINPMTGLPEYANIFSSIGKAVKKFASSTVGKIVTTVALGFFLGPAAASMLGVTSSAGVAAVGGFLGGAGSTLLGGGSLKEALRAGAIGGLTAGAAQGVTGGAGAFTSGSYTGPTTISGQFDRLMGNAPAPTPLVEAGPAPDLASRSTMMANEFVGPNIPETPTTSNYPIGSQTPAPIAPEPTVMTQAGQQVPYSQYQTMPQAPQPSYLDQAKGLYDKYMPEALGGSRGAVTPDMVQAQMPKAAQMVLTLRPDLTPGSGEFSRLVAAKATELATPGLLSTYGPAAALGLGATALAGGFKTAPATMPLGPQKTGVDLLRERPDLYRLYFGGLGPGTQRYNPYLPPLPPVGMAEGGIADLNKFPRKTGHIKGPGTGTSDSIPAMLSDGEFVFTAKAVRSVGNGSRRKGAKRLYKLMKALESNNVHN